MAHTSDLHIKDLKFLACSCVVKVQTKPPDSISLCTVNRVKSEVVEIDYITRTNKGDLSYIGLHTGFICSSQRGFAGHVRTRTHTQFSL